MKQVQGRTARSLAEDNEARASAMTCLIGERCSLAPPLRTLLETAGFEVTGIELDDVPHVHASADAAVR